MATAKASKKPLLIGALVVLGLTGTCCCSCGIGTWAFGKRNLDATAARFDGLDAACRGQGVPGAAPVVADGAIHAQAYDDDGDMLHYWVPADMRSSSLADTEVVICRTGPTESYDVERCDYETGIVTGLTGGENVIVRQGYRAPYRVVAAQTGQTIAEQVVVGQAPEACPATADFDTGGETDRFRGDLPDGDEVSAWVRTLPL